MTHETEASDGDRQTNRAGLHLAAGARARAGTIALPVIGALFGSQAFVLGKTIVRAFNFLSPGARPNATSEAQAGLLTIGIGLLVVVAAKALLSKRDSEANDHLVATTATTVIAGAFSILKEISDPQAAGPVWAYAIYVAAVALLFVVPTFALPGASTKSAAELYARSAIAALAGLLVGTVIQVFVAVLPGIWFPKGTALDGQQAPFFQVAPMGIGLLMPAWALVAFDPALRPFVWAETSRARRGLWTSIYVALAVILCLLYGLAADHGNVVVLLLMLPSLLAIGLVLWFTRLGETVRKEDRLAGPRGPVVLVSRSFASVWPAVLAAGSLAGCASACALLLLQGLPPARIPAVIFVTAHLAASAGAALAFGVGAIASPGERSNRA
ncbi:hypothetical protein ACWGS9_15465 [Bradyrhizobium sp. Arg314]